jgi:RES domain
MRPLVVRRGGAWLRVVDPDWEDPLDLSFSRARGGRWDPPGEFGMVYLNADRRTARANVARRYAGYPYGPEDLDDIEAPELCALEVADGDYIDCETDAGLVAVGLPTSYPHDDQGNTVAWGACQPVGRHAYRHGLDGVAARSAAEEAASGDRELAHIPRRQRPQLQLRERLPFSRWFWDEPTAAR